MELLSPDQLVLLPLWYVAFILAVTCHEAAHAMFAWLGGDPTAYVGGQVSLNPWPHMRREPLGTILVPFVSFLLSGWMMGWASAPYDPYWEDRHPRRAALMALGGPLANLVLATLSFAILKVGLLAEWWILAEYASIERLVSLNPGAPDYLNGVAMFASVSLLLNSALFVFNLFPVPPLDGASVLAGISVWGRKFRERMQSSFSFMGILLAWVLFGRVFWPLYIAVVGLLD